MRLSRLLTTALVAIVCGAGPALTAQEGGRLVTSYVSLGQNFAHGHSHDLTQTTWKGPGSFNAEVGFDFKLPAGNLKIRPNGGFSRMWAGKRDEPNPNLYDLTGIYGGIDAVYSPIAKYPVSITTGPSFHTWHINRADPMGSIPNQGNSGIKFGWRLGVGYTIIDSVRVDLVFTQTEWRTIEQTNPIKAGWNPSRPSYFTLKGSYCF
jgi:hypothetical protein